MILRAGDILHGDKQVLSPFWEKSKKLADAAKDYCNSPGFTHERLKQAWMREEKHNKESS
jgi:hypothetical protein